MMGDSFTFLLESGGIEEDVLKKELYDDAVGAVLIFEGRVRDRNEGKRVVGLEYQAYGGLAMKEGRRILDEEVKRWGLHKAVAVQRTGRLEIGDCAVWVGVSAGHRGAVFEGGRAIMERLKYELPVWKKETYEDGASEWVGPDGKDATTGEVADWSEAGVELVEIWISPGNDFRGHHGEPRGENGIELLDEVECVAGMGLKGDRYFGYKPDFKGQVTFFSMEAVEAVREKFSKPELSGSVFRRNLIVKGVDLSEWVGKRFRFQGVVFEGSEECKPCYWMDEVVGAGAEEFLKSEFRGGLRARIVTDGVIKRAL